MPGGALTGGRWLDIAPERTVTWLSDFVDRHGNAEVVPVAEATSGSAPASARTPGTGASAAAVRYIARDAAIAECHVPFPPLADEAVVKDGDPDPVRVAERIAAHAMAERTVGVLLVRLGGFAAGVFTGAPPRLAASKTGARLVHGRSAAGGTSQQRFARRREKQASQALSAAADAAASVFEKFAGEIDAVVLGGDKIAIGRLREDPRLRPYFDLAVDRFLTVPEPRLAVLRDAPRLFRAVRIRLIEPAPRAAPRR
ncbi:MAG: acVLRF1 family peptidyl-tRNA hydrolase [Micromonosporaceae bacterium]